MIKRTIGIIGIFFYLVSLISCLGGLGDPPGSGDVVYPGVKHSDGVIVAWATGHEDYLVGTDDDDTSKEVGTEWQNTDNALGPAGTDPLAVVSLGRGGSITLTFDKPIVNGPGADFVVFENGIDYGSGTYFLELARVEVKDTDGTDPFKAFSVDVDPAMASAGQIGAYEGMNPDLIISGLASSTILGYGTPFDLEDVGLEQATRVKLIDVLGDGSEIDDDETNPASADSTADTIYDPYPTYDSAGFDLDAVGVINQ